MEISLESVIEAARRRRAGVTAEVAGYLVLLAVKGLDAGPRHVSAAALLLTEAGELRISAGNEATAMEAEAELRRLLATLTSLAQTTSPALEAATQTSARGDLSAFHDELFSALIPLNHAAARRALARLYRETSRATLGGSPSASAATSEALTPSAAAARADAFIHAAVEVGTGLGMQEIDIEVEVEAGRSVALPARVSAGMAEEGEGTLVAAPSVCDWAGRTRNEVEDLLAGFLAHTRNDERMSADLRKMIGI